MIGITGYGVYVPWYRIKLSEISRAWKAQGEASGEKSVPAPDEDAFAFAFKAARSAVAHSGTNPSNIGAVYVASTSSPYIERSLASPIVFALGAPRGAIPADLGASPRAATVGMNACIDSIKSGRIKSGLVAGTDALVGGPGDELELYSGAGACAVVIGSDGVIAEIEDCFSYTTDFVERWRDAKSQYPRLGDGRFVRDHGYMDHVSGAASGLMGKMKLKPADFKHVVLQQPNPRWAADASKKLGFAKEQTAAGTTVPYFGDTGAASVLLGLASVLDTAKSGDRILAVSYGSGGSDAFSLVVREQIEKKRGKTTAVSEFVKKKEYVDYFTHLRFNKVVSKFT